MSRKAAVVPFSTQGEPPRESPKRVVQDVSGICSAAATVSAWMRLGRRVRGSVEGGGEVSLRGQSNPAGRLLRLVSACARLMLFKSNQW